MKGVVDNGGRSLLTVEIRSSDPSANAEIEVWIDTGFTGDLDNAAFSAPALRLPIFYHRLFTAKSCWPSHPKYASAEVSVCSRVIEQQSRLPFELVAVELIVHHQEGIDIIWLRLICNKRAVNNKPCQMPC